MIRLRHGWTVGLLAGLLAAIQSCGDSTAPGGTPVIEFGLTDIDLQAGRDTVVEVRNTGTAAIGPVQLVSLSVRNAGGGMVPGAQLQATPSEIATLIPGAGATVTVSITTPAGVAAGSYRVGLEARSQAVLLASTVVRFSVGAGSGPPQANTVRITGGPSAFTRGDVVQFSAEVLDSTGTAVPGAPLTWTVLGFGLFASDGRFVAYSTGPIRVVASSGTAADTMAVTVSDRTLTGSLQVVGQGQVDPNITTSDLWVNGSVLYSGTHASGGGGRFYAWSLANPTAPSQIDSLVIDARVVNDVKIRDDGTLAVITHEGSADGQNGVTLLDMTDPNHPTVITRYTQGLAAGIHNAWIDGTTLYLVTDGTNSTTGGLRILDISNPSNPVEVGSFYGGTGFLHDVYVRNGLAILSHWSVGLIIVDVGNGIAGGSPSNPVEVSRLTMPGYLVHNAWYWPAGGYIFLGDEVNRPGTMRVIDVSDLRRPSFVATYRALANTPHNFWLDETRGILYLAWYASGVRALDVNGPLMGELEREGREIAGLVYDGGTTMSWAPQLHNGLVYVSDFNTGIKVLQPNF